MLFCCLCLAGAISAPTVVSPPSSRFRAPSVSGLDDDDSTIGQMKPVRGVNVGRAARNALSDDCSE
jgi:hypothetical protein